MGALRLEDLPRYDYDDYKIWEGRWELIDGIAYAMAPSPIDIHQDVSGNIHIELKSLLKKCKNCKASLAVDWKISNETVVCPDNSIVCNKEKTNFIETVPEVIFEVLSPSTKKKDRTIKYNIFQEQGVKYYILVEPKGSFAEVYKLINGYYKLEGEFTDENYTFEVDDCEINFEFKNIFED
ncbi:MAG: Uma2 family endonuclease [Campylobacterota bacterium]|nr:Uma2 family endonuclease [Campylobacterota bacterium]